MANCPKKGRENSLSILLYIWVKRRVNGREIVQTFQLCLCRLPNVIDKVLGTPLGGKLSKKGQHKTLTSILIRCVKWQWFGHENVDVYVLRSASGGLPDSSCSLNKIQRDTFRWQIVQKKVGIKLLPWYWWDVVNSNDLAMKILIFMFYASRRAAW